MSVNKMYLEIGWLILEFCRSFIPVTLVSRLIFLIPYNNSYDGKYVCESLHVLLSPQTPQDNLIKLRMLVGNCPALSS